MPLAESDVRFHRLDVSPWIAALAASKRSIHKEEKSVATAVSKYEELVSRLEGHDGVAGGQMFGKACLKIHGKAFVSQHKETVVFKLTGPAHAKAIALAGAVLWDPSGKGRPMKEWIALPVAQSKHFESLAEAALLYVGGVAV